MSERSAAVKFLTLRNRVCAIYWIKANVLSWSGLKLISRTERRNISTNMFIFIWYTIVGGVGLPTKKYFVFILTISHLGPSLLKSWTTSIRNWRLEWLVIIYKLKTQSIKMSIEELDDNQTFKLTQVKQVLKCIHLKLISKFWLYHFHHLSML